jgi:hypothetical protein
MLVSHRYKFIYTKTVKTGSTSVESYFERFCFPDGQWEQLHHREAYESTDGIVGYRGLASDVTFRKWYNHMSAALIRERLGEKIWNTSFKFCVIRDPFEKAISAFEHFGRDHFPLSAPGIVTEQERFLHWLKEIGPPIDRDKYMIDGQVCIDDFIRYETLYVDIERICVRLRLPWDPSLLPFFKRGMRRQTAQISNLYTPAAIDLVARLYDFEINHFDYNLPECTE